MGAHASDLLDDVVARITSPDPREVTVPDDVTGELRRLLLWWRGLVGPATPDAVDVALSSPAPDVVAAVEAGVQAADRAVDAGHTLLVPRVGRRDEVAARTVIALLTRRESSAVLDQPEGMSDRDWMDLCARVRDRMAQVADTRGEPLAMLAALGAASIAGVAGALLGAAARRTPCLVDGTDELAAALVADRLCYRAREWWRAGSDSPDPGRTAAVERIDLAPGLPLALTDDTARGAQATVALLRDLAHSVSR